MRLSKLLEKISEKKRKVYALVLVGAIIATSIPSGFLKAGSANAEGEIDITNAEGISYGFQNFSASVGGNNIALNESGNVFSLPDNTAITAVDSITGELQVSVVDVEERDADVFKEGNYFKITLPEIFQLEDGE